MGGCQRQGGLGEDYGRKPFERLAFGGAAQGGLNRFRDFAGQGSPLLRGFSGAEFGGDADDILDERGFRRQ